MSINTAPATWAGGEIPPASKYNSEIRDPFIGIQAAWDSWTPTWSGATTDPVIGNGTIAGAYLQLGKTIHFRVTITMGSTTTYGAGQWRLTWPTPGPPLASARWLWVGAARDASAGTTFPIVGEYSTSTLMVLRAWPATAGNALQSAGAAAPFTWASGDDFTIAGFYEGA